MWHKRYLPYYCNWDGPRALTNFEKLVVEHSECLEDSYAFEVANHLLALLDDPERNNKSVQIMHAIWFRLMRIRKFEYHIVNSWELKTLNQRVSDKSASQMLRLARLQLKWNPWLMG
jgi:hypothetical protein